MGESAKNESPSDRSELTANITIKSGDSQLAFSPDFKDHLQAVHASFVRLIEMSPVVIAALPKDAPESCIYLLSEGATNLYVGRTGKQGLKKRLSQHSRRGSQQNQASFAFKLAREATGNTRAGYTAATSRKVLAQNSRFAEAFDECKGRVRAMHLRYVEERDPLRQTLLEIYTAFVLNTPYNDFDTH